MPLYLIETLIQQGGIALVRQRVQYFADFARDNPRYQVTYLRALALLAEREGNQM